MDYQCFYCDYNIDHDKVHFVTFFKEDYEREEILCNECYLEWLEGIKE